MMVFDINQLSKNSNEKGEKQPNKNSLMFLIQFLQFQVRND